MSFKIGILIFFRVCLDFKAHVFAPFFSVQSACVLIQ